MESYLEQFHQEKKMKNRMLALIENMEDITKNKIHQIPSYRANVLLRDRLLALGMERKLAEEVVGCLKFTELVTQNLQSVIDPYAQFLYDLFIAAKRDFKEPQHYLLHIASKLEIGVHQIDDTPETLPIYRLAILLHRCLIQKGLNETLADRVIGSMHIEATERALEDASFIQRVVEGYATVLLRIYQQACCDFQYPEIFLLQSARTMELKINL